MGHKRLGRLPATKKWNQVVRLLGEGADLDAIAAAAAIAAEGSLPKAAQDPALIYSFWLLTQIPLAARTQDFVANLHPRRRLPQGRQLHPLQLQRRLLLVSLWPRQPAAVRHRGHARERQLGYIVGTYDKDAGTNNQRLYLNGTRVAQMSDIQPLDLNANPLGIGRHVTGVADPFNGHIDAFRIAHVQRSDGWIETTWNNMSDPGAFAVAAAEEQEGGEPLPLAGAGVVVSMMA